VISRTHGDARSRHASGQVPDSASPVTRATWRASLARSASSVRGGVCPAAGQPHRCWYSRAPSSRAPRVASSSAALPVEGGGHRASSRSREHPHCERVLPSARAEAQAAREKGSPHSAPPPRA
jgi:hypothetical protein